MYLLGHIIQEIGERRDKEICARYSKGVFDNGLTVQRFYDSYDSAWDILGMFIDQTTQPLSDGETGLRFPLTQTQVEILRHTPVPNTLSTIRRLIPTHLVRVEDMRLLHLDEFPPDDTTILQLTNYAILSHRWGSNELTFQDLEANTESAKSKAGYKKLMRFCEKARQYGCKYVWMDTCCINKRGVELEGSIESMFGWYRHAKICIVHLAETFTTSDLPRESWFQRGWTLLELLAPWYLKFFNCGWEPLTGDHYDRQFGGDTSKSQLWQQITTTTGISLASLQCFTPGRCQASQLLQWMSKRKTTYPEDMAYSLVGLLNIRLEIAYGEGETIAFHRLKAQILGYNLNTIRQYIEDNLPMYLFRISDQKLVHHEKLVDFVVDDMWKIMESGKMDPEIQEVTKYAVLSHVWETEELTFSKLVGCPSLHESKVNHRKLVRFCEKAREYNCRYVWIDTGCINKESNVDVEKSIHSAFAWYRNAEICVVYLARTDDLTNLADDPWFTRGWTLQELLAPRSLKFFNRNWKPLTPDIYDKSTGFDPSASKLWRNINRITGIPFDILISFNPSRRHAPQILEWVSQRKTTLPEDMTYCLLGMIDVRFRIAYGEGQDKASRRLQETMEYRVHILSLPLYSRLPIYLCRVSDQKLVHREELMVSAWNEMKSKGEKEGYLQQVAKYAILSHRWETRELTSQAQHESTAGNQKLLQLCEQATKHGCRYAWIDTVCINKRSNFELEESIRSMYNWYQDAEVCIVHLAETDDLKNLPNDPWFKRGWTLQELLAPRRLKFFNRNWKPITLDEYDKSPGCNLSVSGLWQEISKITGIPFETLGHFSPSIQHAPQVHDWVSKRETTLHEDIIYCRIIMLDIRLAIAYGEGPESASRRLNEKILEQSLHLIRYHIYNRLPIYLLRVSDIKLIRRESMMGPVLDELVKTKRVGGTTDNQIREVTKYAILSHQWGREELTFHDMETGIQLLEEKIAHMKLLRLCEKAKDYGCRYAWIDTACINKQSSAELEESIRSMYNWYQDAEICIVHLAATDTMQQLGGDGWFTRGWTLQELLAPKKIKFFNRLWQPLTKNKYDKCPTLDPSGSTLWKSIQSITSIPMASFRDFMPGTHHARQVLEWVSRRQTTRSEDIAYCLIGILGVKPTIAYGEGEDSAFHRLQEAILQRSDDRGMFLWTGGGSSQNSMLASHPSCFCPSVWEDTVTAFLFGDELKDPTIVFTTYGLRIMLSICDVQFQWASGSKYRLCVEGLGTAGLQLSQEPERDRAATWKVGILGSARVETRDTLFAILLERDGVYLPPRYRRIATKDLIQFPCPKYFKFSPERVYII